MNRRTALWLAGIAAVVIVGVIVAVAVLTGGPTEPEQASRDREGEAALAVKIDNVAAARPQTGLADADTVYVLPVEGGLTRLMGIYTDEVPETVGPVRSARLTDLELLEQYGRPALAYSGASERVLPEVKSSPVISISPNDHPDAFYREAERQAPHNLFLRPEGLIDEAEPPEEPVLQFGPAPRGGEPADRHEVAGANLTFLWSDQDERWQVQMDGQPVTPTDSGPVSATTVVEQEVTVESEGSPDAAGNAPPFARTVGSGDATVLRDGQRFDAQWSRPDPGSPTRFQDAEGNAVPLEEGHVWIVVVPKAG